ncbi:putative IAH1 Isoamyl acetate hydrolytic enzyme [Venustampulla echinocandica]|uniref:Putative IAH1 Isoamyl acetate hydrolytic enzyme n=1 Tax=Venustampulla echinocandica TaxID=2656787 RepID=A0A370TRI5_9HELO|nr:putative IAH1 Isoamyl acetate hydrolytic enzyme [Venustampulla echinocandica]RDL38147.1 putative IAH1 Isoamyl acetate hydrolytic enzyme [Venustampulla echinocandica]
METKRTVYGQFILLGDSHIQHGGRLSDGFCFGGALTEHVERRLDVINRGFSGYNSSNIMAILEHLFPSISCAKVDYLLILLGSNDSRLPENSANQHVPLEEYRSNIKGILTYPLVRSHNPVIFLVTPPPINEVQLEQFDRDGGNTVLSRHQSVTAQYAAAIRDLAEEFKDQRVVLVDLWAALMKEAIALTPDYVEGGGLLGSRERGDSQGFRRLLTDGLHLTPAGYKVLLDTLLPLMGEGWTGDAAKASWIFPAWDSEVAPLPRK